MALYPYQTRVKEILLSGRSVILQAPTGTGKTRAALSPYIEAFFDRSPSAFPHKCIYSVPMRVLANQFFAEYSELTASYYRRTHQKMRTGIQTGEQPLDPKYLQDLIFAPIDQSLSSALAVPYSLSTGMANLNAGAFYASYLVFDEFHLFPLADEDGAQGALTTTLQLLMQIKGIVPFILMTATFSSTMLAELARLLDAEVVQVSPDEYQKIAAGDIGRPRSRQYFVHTEPLTAAAILAEHSTRSVAICNQVRRAQDLFEALREAVKGTNIHVELIHSRFTPEDRKRKEELIQREFGKDCNQHQTASFILVATQVIEVGVDITSENLHTEIAPANSVFQRAGRCARYPGEQGRVHLYPVPQRELTNGFTKPDYLPYSSSLCEQAWQSFLQRNGQTIDFTEEQVVIDEVHTESDRRLLEAMQRQSNMLWEDIYGAMQEGLREQRANLIRRVDNITVLSASVPEAVGNPYKAQGFGLQRGTVKGLLKTLQEYAQGWTPENDDQRWLMKFPLAKEPNPDDPTEPITFVWQEVTDGSLLDATALVVINCAFCAYDEMLGFRIVPPEFGGWSSQAGEFKRYNSQDRFSYNLESYTDHIRNMLNVYRDNFTADYAYVQKRIVQQWNLPIEGLTTAIRLAIALHDVAKMDKRWQRWVRLYQQAIGEPIAEPNYMAVHTHWVPAFPEHQTAKKSTDRQCKRPPHAGESAVASARIIAELSGHPSLGRAVITAIARHHSAQTREFGDYELHTEAMKAVLSAVQVAQLGQSRESLLTRNPNAKLSQFMIKPKEFQELLLYLWVVRMLRLCDGLSQE